MMACSIENQAFNESQKIKVSNHRVKHRWNKLPTMQPSAETQFRASHKCMNSPRSIGYLSIKTLKLR